MFKKMHGTQDAQPKLVISLVILQNQHLKTMKLNMGVVLYLRICLSLLNKWGVGKVSNSAGRTHVSRKIPLQRVCLSPNVTGSAVGQKRVPQNLVSTTKHEEIPTKR